MSEAFLAERAKHKIGYDKNGVEDVIVHLRGTERRAQAMVASGQAL
jgi:hypothetical protein